MPGPTDSIVPAASIPGVHGGGRLAAAHPPQTDVGRVHGRGADRDPHLPRAGRADLAVDDRQDLGAAGLGYADGAHRWRG